MVARSRLRLISSPSRPTPYLPSLISATPPPLSLMSHHLWWHTSKRACCQVVFLVSSRRMKPALVSQTSSRVSTSGPKLIFASLCFSSQSTMCSTSMARLMAKTRMRIRQVLRPVESTASSVALTPS